MSKKLFLFCFYWHLCISTYSCLPCISIGQQNVSRREAGPFWVEVDKCMLYLLHVLFPKHETGSKGNGGPTNWKKRKVLRKKKSQEDQSCSVHLEEQVWPRPDSSSQRRQKASTGLPQATWRSAWGWQGNKIHFRGVGNGGVWRRKDCDQRKKKMWRWSISKWYML